MHLVHRNSGMRGETFDPVLILFPSYDSCKNTLGTKVLPERCSTNYTNSLKLGQYFLFNVWILRKSSRPRYIFL